MPLTANFTKHGPDVIIYTLNDNINNKTEETICTFLNDIISN